MRKIANTNTRNKTNKLETCAIIAGFLLMTAYSEVGYAGFILNAIGLGILALVAYVEYKKGNH